MHLYKKFYRFEKAKYTTVLKTLVCSKGMVLGKAVCLALSIVLGSPSHAAACDRYSANGWNKANFRSKQKQRIREVCYHDSN